MLLQALYDLRSERQMMERLDFDLLFRWFVGLGIDDAVWHPTVYAKNRDRLFEGAVAERFLAAILAHPKVAPLLSREHLSVDGTLIEAWASVKSFQRRDHDTRDSHDTDGKGGPPAGGGRNAERDVHGERRSNAIHASMTEPDALLFRKGAGKDAKLAYTGHLLTENRNGLIVDVRTTRHPGYAASQRARNRIKECFGWMKAGAGGRKARHRGLDRVGWQVTLTAAAYNLVRLPKMIGAAP
jgi:IS5 family transposase